MSWQPQAHTCTHKVRTHGCCWSNGATCWCCQASFPDSLVCSCTCVWKKKDEQSSSQCKTFFFTSCLWANAGQHRRCAAAQPLGRLRRDRHLFLQAVRASRSSDTCWRRLNHVHSFPSWAVDTVWSVILTVAIFLFLCAKESEGSCFSPCLILTSLLI